MTRSPEGRRILISLTVVAVVLAVVMTFVIRAGPRSAITHENATRIRKGMTLAQVEQILGGPARSEEPFIAAWGDNPPTAFWRTRHTFWSAFGSTPMERSPIAESMRQKACWMLPVACWVCRALHETPRHPFRLP